MIWWFVARGSRRWFKDLTKPGRLTLAEADMLLNAFFVKPVQRALEARPPALFDQPRDEA